MYEKDEKTTDHMIWECVSVKPFWSEFAAIIENKFEQLVTKSDVYFGGENGLFSLLSCLAKKYVYDTLKQEKTHIPNIITDTRKIEEFISVKKKQI